MNLAIRTFELEMFVVYEKPRDYPHSFVLRRWTVAGSPIADPLPLAVGPTLEAVRTAIPGTMVNIGRAPGDEPQIVEVWV